jgi:hypothetical protein
MQDLEGKTFIVEAWGKTTEVEIHLGSYQNGRSTAIQLVTTGSFKEPFATLTCNIPCVKLEADEVLIKGWSENEAVAQAALKTGWFEETGKIVPTGFAVAEIWRIK